MSDESGEITTETEEVSGNSAAALALALDGASRDPRLSKAIESFLHRQEHLLTKQAHHLDEQLKKIALSLIDQRLTVALKVLTVIVGVVVAGGFGLMVWKASQARGLVVEAFSAPPDFAARGIGGDVVAQDIMGKLAVVRAFAMDHSYSTSNDVTKDGGDIKVEIPETGISITEAWRLLRNWLGHERYVTGSLRETADGKITLTAMIDGEDAVSLTGATSELPALEKQAAEQIFGRFDPVNYTNYLTATGRDSAAYEVAAHYVQIAQTKLQKSDAYSLWSYTTAYATGDLDLAMDRTHVAVEIDPDLAVAHIQLIRFDRVKGHDEAALAEARTVLTKKDADQTPAHQGHGFAEMRAQASGQIGAMTGDYAGAWEEECAHDCGLAVKRIAQARFGARMHDIAGSRLFIRQARAAGLKAGADYFDAKYWADAEADQWAAAKVDIEAAIDAEGRENSDLNPRYVAYNVSTNYQPLLAMAQARLGELAAAQATIDRTPGDCYDCLRVRGDIAAIQKKWDAAAYWFASAVQQGPSIPFAYGDWGAMLMAKGDLAGAIAHFAEAHKRGPHFADPLEMWGEALIAQNRSDLALAKFAEAAQYAPNWGRLHLKWGEALLWSGDKAGAQKQFAQAAKLGLTAAEQAQLARVRG